MKKDSALEKVMQKTTETLPADFSRRTMEKIIMENVARKKRATILTYLSVSLASLGLIVLGYFLLKDYLTFDFTSGFAKNAFTPESKNILGFSSYIAVLGLLLMFFDRYLRNLRDRRLHGTK